MQKFIIYIDALIIYGHFGSTIRIQFNSKHY